jgi:IPT/TIG domain.
MKHLYTYSFHLTVLVCLSALLLGCEQDAKYRVYEYPMPEVTEMYPTDGYVTSQVVITGTNFGDRAEAVKVFFGAVQATEILMCKNNRIVVEVPETAVSSDVSLQVYTNKLENIGHYTVLPTPVIISMESDNEDGSSVADAGDIVTIIGKNFGTDASDISVSFNGTPAEFTLVDGQTIRAVTPDGYETGNVTVTIHGYDLTAGAMLNPNSKGDVTVLYLENYKQPFASEEENPGDWSKPVGWNQNAASLNPTGCRQQQGTNTFLTFQRGWGKNAVTDGKVWQAVHLRKGTYTMEVTYAETYFPNSDNNALYAVIIPGTDDTAIPNVEDIASVTDLGGVCVAFDNWNPDANAVSGTMVTPAITLDEAADVVIGFLMTVGSSNTYFKVTDVKLVLK